MSLKGKLKVKLEWNDVRSYVRTCIPVMSEDHSVFST